MSRKTPTKTHDAPETWDLTVPAVNSLGETQIGPRSPESDPERCAHLAITVFDTNGYAAHVAGQNAPRMRLNPHRAGMTKADVANTEIPEPHGRGAPYELLERRDADLASVERSVDRDLEREPRMIRHPNAPTHYLANALAHLAPMDRFFALGGKAVRPDKRPPVPRSAVIGGGTLSLSCRIAPGARWPSQPVAG